MLGGQLQKVSVDRREGGEVGVTFARGGAVAAEYIGPQCLQHVCASPKSVRIEGVEVDTRNERHGEW